MNKSLEEKFEAIAQEAIEKAEAVECSLPDFANGLDLIVSLIRDRFEIAREENEKS